MKKISAHITYEEAIRTSKDVENVPQEHQLALMTEVADAIFEPARKALGGKPLPITSFFRSIELNKAIGGAFKVVDGKYRATSQHCKGMAIDVDAGKKNAALFFYILDNLEFDQLIWEKGDSKNPAWVHFSFNKKRNRKQALILRDGSYHLYNAKMVKRPKAKPAAKNEVKTKPAAKKAEPKAAAKKK